MTRLWPCLFAVVVERDGCLCLGFAIAKDGDADADADEDADAEEDPDADADADAEERATPPEKVTASDIVAKDLKMAPLTPFTRDLHSSQVCRTPEKPSRPLRMA